MSVDARVTRSGAAVVRAATDLLVDGGPTAVTVDAIVARSGVAKSTIYRHWDSRDDILLDVITNCAPTLTEPDPDLGFVTALQLVLGEIAAALTDPEWNRVFPALLTLRNHEDGVAHIEQQLEARQERVVDAVLKRGIEEGAVRADVDLDQAGALLVGPLLFANLVGKPALDRHMVDRVIESFLALNGTDRR